MTAVPPKGGEAGGTPVAEDLERSLFSSLDPASTVALSQAKLTDRSCLALMLQGAALLAHCEAAGACLPDGWSEARVSSKGLMWVPRIVPGRMADYPQAMLLDLLGLLFRSAGAPAGRGEARRSARRIEAQLRQQLTPVPGDRVLGEIFESAPFLWDPAFADARRALMVRSETGKPWLVGPGPACRRLLKAANGDGDELVAILGSPAARDLWEGFDAGVAPEELAAAGRWGLALAAWDRRETLGATEALDRARAAMALGRHQQALDTLAGRRGVVVGLLRLRCQLRLGKLLAAKGGLKTLREARLDGAQRLELASLTSQILAPLDRQDEIESQVESILEPVDGPPHGLALVRAEAAWDEGDLKAADEHLEAARADALDDPEWAGRWLHLAGQWALMVGDGLRAEEYVARSLRLERRRLTPFRAARRWSDLAMARVFSDDLVGAERACRHAERLLWGSEGPVRTTLVLYNLAEVRLRRGRLSGIETVLEQSTAENRRSGNRKSLIRDLELWVRLELAQGRCEEALTRCVEAQHELEAGDPEGRAVVFELLAARAHGWLARPRRAAARLDRVDDEAFRELEPEERPAVLALAGKGDDAVSEAATTPWADLWGALAAGLAPESRCWEGLDGLEPYRAARLVFDCECLRPGIAPPSRVRRAVVVFREAGMPRLAERLEGHSLGPWRALEAYASTRRDMKAAAELLSTAGYQEARLSWQAGDNEHPRGGGGSERVLIDGDSGGERLVAPWAGGRMVLEVSRIDPVLRAIFALLQGDLEPPVQPESAARRAGGGRGGIWGESKVILAAIDRLERLAGSDLPLLLLGESGTGKEVFARYAHRLSRRSSESKLEVNCAAFSETLIQSELFGHVRGAFTGADRDRQGVFESARGGTVFLDEIGDLPLSVQGNLLRVLQEGSIRRVGESHARKVDVRIMAATHRDLGKMVARKEFREDLYYRLKVATIEIPPLRDRGRDALVIARRLLEEKRRHRPELRLSSEAEKALLAHDWPGNVRELSNVLDLAVALSEDGTIEARHLELPTEPREILGTYHQLVENYRCRLLEEARDECRGNRGEMSRRLGLSRQALSYLLRKFGLI